MWGVAREGIVANATLFGAVGDFLTFAFLETSQNRISWMTDDTYHPKLLEPIRHCLDEQAQFLDLGQCICHQSGPHPASGSDPTGRSPWKPSDMVSTSTVCTMSRSRTLS